MTENTNSSSDDKTSPGHKAHAESAKPEAAAAEGTTPPATDQAQSTGTGDALAVVPTTTSPEDGSLLSDALQEPDRLLFTPPIDIYETEEGLVLHADLPGVSSESLELQVQDNKLTLFGRVLPSVPEDAELLHGEYHVGDFLRSFILSDEVDHERVTASLNNGVLKVVLPKAEKSRPRRIPVKTD